MLPTPSRTLLISYIGVGPFVGSVIAVLFYRFIKTLEYEVCRIIKIPVPKDDG